MFEGLSDEDKFIRYFIILLIIPFIIFFPLEFIWAKDPFQKVILAPLGEEPLKLLIASLLCYIIYKNIKSSNKNLFFNKIFFNFFVFFSIIAGFIIGFSEGAIGNIFLHISSSSIGAILILSVYLKVKNKYWKNRYKLATMFVTLIVPMFIHSISNQFHNIIYANNNPSFNYLVVIGRFLSNNTLSDNTLKNDAFLFSILIFVIALSLIIIWHLYLIYLFYHQKKLQQVKITK